MKKHLLRNILVPLTILSLTLSFIAVLPATGQEKTLIISKLRQLNNMLEGEQPSLRQKVNAVIHQIEAGAYHSALNKLQNDVKKSIAAKVAHPQELLKLVDEIISLIKGVTPPKPTPDFELMPTPDQVTIPQGNSDTITIIVFSDKGFNNPVTLTITSQPITGIKTTISQLELTPPPNGAINATLTVTVAQNATPTEHEITVTGTSNSLHHDAQIQLTVLAVLPPTVPDFAINTNPKELSIMQGSFATFALNLTSKNNFSQPVNITVVSTSSGVAISPDQFTVTPPKNSSSITSVRLDVATNAAIGNFTITITGKSESLPQKTAKISLRITGAVVDHTPPVIVTVLRNPEDPAYTENVTVTALVYDTESGVKQVELNYTVNTKTTIVNMIIINGLYTATIPKLAYHTLVQYEVAATDNANNTATSNTYTYSITDPVPPIARILQPSNGSYLAGEERIQVFMQDQNGGGESGFRAAELSINDTPVKTWTTQPSAGTDSYLWNTTSGQDGLYTIRLAVSDKAGNIAAKTITVTVDNTLPMALINLPTPGAYIRLNTLIKVTGTDNNFDKMEVRIDNALVKTFTQSGFQILEWNTKNSADGVHSVSLTVYDRAGNMRMALINVTVDNTPPEIGAATWSPKQPTANVDIRINVTATEPVHGSGIQNVTLAFINNTLDDWRFVPMQLSGGNWTAMLTNQGDTEVRFYVEAFDNAGNSNKTTVDTFKVGPPTGVSLAWVLAVVAIIAAAIGGTVYYLRQRGKPPNAPKTT